MPGQITVDTKNETVALEFVDDKGNIAAPPKGATVTFASDNPQAATVAVDATNPFQGDITPVGVGTTNLSATLNGAMEADGTTPIPNPAPISLEVDPGAAAGARLTLA